MNQQKEKNKPTHHRVLNIDLRAIKDEAKVTNEENNAVKAIKSMRDMGVKKNISDSSQKTMVANFPTFALSPEKALKKDEDLIEATEEDDESSNTA